MGDVVLGDREFALFRDLLYAEAGIALGPQKRVLVQSRLARRLRALGLVSYGEYYRYLAEHDPAGAERRSFVNALTTNKTEFFREAHHFQYLAETWAPALRARASATGSRRVRVWSAACSTGEEPYTIAMTLADQFDVHAGWDVRILASDIDTEVLAHAEAGLYAEDRLDGIPSALRSRFFTRAAPPPARMVVRPEIRQLISFRRINFRDEAWPIRARFDAIFCRNVLIYFNREDQQRLLERLRAFLADDGCLFLGHSESVVGLMTGVRQVGTTIYQVVPA